MHASSADRPQPTDPTRTQTQGPTDAPTGAAPGLSFAQASGERFSGVVDRRSGLDRRLVAKMKAELEGQEVDETDETGLERRRGPGRRRTDFTKSAEEGEMTSEQFLFIAAIEAFKRSNNKMFPTWTDVLEVMRLLGYRKTMPSELNLRNAEDWTEKPDTAHGVRSKPGHREGGNASGGSPSNVERRRDAA